MNIADLLNCLNEIQSFIPDIPDEKIISIDVQNETEIKVTTGFGQDHLRGSGMVLKYELIEGKWMKTEEPGCIS